MDHSGSSSGNGDNGDNDDRDGNDNDNPNPAEGNGAHEEHGSANNVNATKHTGGGIRLLQVLFKHAHSNSIAHIIQRLLMPRPAYLDHVNGGGAGNDANHEEEEEEDEDDELNDVDEFGGLNCDWADSEVGLNLLLDHLLVDPTQHATREEHHDDEDEGNDEKEEEEMDKILSASQHACEILTTVIQHSPLDSNIMKTMTGEPILTRLIDCACGTEDQSPISTFSMHDSTMTTAMNVMEILILQLGGYGTVPTSGPPGNYDDHDANGDASDGTCAKPGGEEQDDASDSLKEAEAAALIRVLPSFLNSLLHLLKHPQTERWKSNFQYSMKPQQMLGASRLRIVRLIESLVLLSLRDVDLILCGSECLEICLNFFWEFPWCSMLHQSVANLLVHILEGGDERIDLQLYFLNRCNLPKRLMDSFESPLFSSSSEDRVATG